MLRFGGFPDYWLQSWIVAFGIWVIIRGIGWMIEDFMSNNVLEDNPNTEDEHE
jgi:hypothetical protein